MTYREYVEKFYPENVNPSSTGGVIGCPGTPCYGFPNANRVPECRKKDGDRHCNACWDQEIPVDVLVEKLNEKIEKGKITKNQAREMSGFEPLPEPNKIINKEENVMTNKTKTQLFDEINQKAQEIADLKKELEKLEKYKAYEKAGDEMYAIMKAFMNSGFSREEAFALITTSMQVFSR